MKPIFEEERKFLEAKGGMQIPKSCWRDNGFIYLNYNDKDYFMKITTKLDYYPNIDCDFGSKSKRNKRRIKYWDYIYKRETPIKWLDEYKSYKDVLEAKVRKSINLTKGYLLYCIYTIEDLRVLVSVSGGKDSEVTKHIVDAAIKEIKEECGLIIKYKLVYFNPTNETADTYGYIKEVYRLTSKDIISPDKGFYKWIEEDKNFFIPQVTANTRMCCAKFKEGQLHKVMDKDENTLTLLGMRSDESKKRKDYDYDLNEAIIKSNGKLNVYTNWLRFLPIVEWTDLDVWFYILSRDLPINNMYKLGFDRVGCLICYYSSDYTLALIDYFYPKLYNKWLNVLSNHYEVWGVKKRLKWSELEFMFEGKWKTGLSKEYEIIQQKPTDRNLERLSCLKNLPKEMCKKYFNRVCKCGKKMNPTEIAMFLKVMGRYENTNDNREYLCKECLCNEIDIDVKEYKELSVKFMKEDCNLF